MPSNIDENYTSEILKDLVGKKVLVNKHKSKGNSSISNLTTEVMAIKNFIIGELYSLSRSIDCVRSEQIDHTNFMGDVKKIWEENSNKNVIKT